MLILGVNKNNLSHIDVLQVELCTRCCRNIIKLFLWIIKKNRILWIFKLYKACVWKPLFKKLPYESTRLRSMSFTMIYHKHCFDLDSGLAKIYFALYSSSIPRRLLMSWHLRTDLFSLIRRSFPWQSSEGGSATVATPLGASRCATAQIGCSAAGCTTPAVLPRENTAWSIRHRCKVWAPASLCQGETHHCWE